MAGVCDQRGKDEGAEFQSNWKVNLTAPNGKRSSIKTTGPISVRRECGKVQQAPAVASRFRLSIRKNFSRR